MRLHLITSPNKEIVPFNYQPKLVGILHKWLGENDLHGTMAMYSFSSLQNGKASKNGIDFRQGARMFISFHHDEHIKTVLSTLMKKPEMCYGMHVEEVIVEPNPDLLQRSLFSCASPVFIHRFDKEKNMHYSFEDQNAGLLLAETLKNKMNKAGLPEDNTLDIQFDLSYPNKKTKLIDYKSIKNKVSVCPLIIDGTPQSKLFAWNTGVGNSTGIGFGAIK